MNRIGIIGFGDFGQFIHQFLNPYFDIKIYDIHLPKNVIESFEIKSSSLDEIIDVDVLVLCVPVQFLEKTLLDIKEKVKKGTLVVDVSSVKMKPIELMLKHLPKDVDILGTHPLFGPQSGANGISGLNMVLCPIRVSDIRLRCVTQFLEDELELNLLKRTAEVHDKQMAYVQAFTHFIGRAINEMDIPDIEQKTPAYQYLLDIKRNLGKDSLDLFLTIERENPYSEEVLGGFMNELQRLKELI
jgi:prephenate dehydrogenase